MYRSHGLPLNWRVQEPYCKGACRMTAGDAEDHRASSGREHSQLFGADGLMSTSSYFHLFLLPILVQKWEGGSKLKGLGFFRQSRLWCAALAFIQSFTKSYFYYAFWSQNKVQDTQVHRCIVRYTTNWDTPELSRMMLPSCKGCSTKKKRPTWKYFLQLQGNKPSSRPLSPVYQHRYNISQMSQCSLSFQNKSLLPYWAWCPLLPEDQKNLNSTSVFN